ncbi:hypothetical protein MTR67_019154 [Solanum verrucosum]|uniref:Reverse transcriptase zinc-binding domain-containing protein n=1 Tax=Solanum verrucosum TaxID=315347 RepID=A0AAF0QL01_SOLVR|nr:hypothetical protein MTR67_019154 [Solanum verrucosum]
MEATHLQYADDTLIFCDAEEGQLLILRSILVLFEGVSGLHINWRKSQLFPINEVPNMLVLSGILGGEVGPLPTMYLGSEENVSTVRHLVKWNEVLWGKKQGGLGVRNLKIQSKALRLKWLWRYSQEPQAYWGKVIKAIYGVENKWMTNEVSTPYGVSLWRSIRILWPFLRNNTAVRVGNGSKTSFWEDNWLGHASLKNLFPERALAEFKGTKNEVDRLWWNKDNKGMYKVNSAYKFLNKGGQQPPNWPWKQIWKTKTPFKVACFTWLLAREAVLTQENLNKRKFSMCSRCYLCGEEVEEIDDIEDSSGDPFVADAIANERELNLSEEQKRKFKKVKEEDDLKIDLKLRRCLKQRRHKNRQKLVISML